MQNLISISKVVFYPELLDYCPGSAKHLRTGKKDVLPLQWVEFGALCFYKYQERKHSTLLTELTYDVYTHTDSVNV